MATKLGRYPRLINWNLNTAKAQIADGKLPQGKTNSNKNFFYIISFFLTAFFAIFIFTIGTLSESNIELFAKFLDTVPYFDLKLSRELFHQLHFPGPVSNTLFAANFLFLAYITYDVLLNHKQVSFRDGDLFKESSSVSYSIHIAILLWILLSVMVSYKPRPKVQVTRIEFTAQETGSKKSKPSKAKRQAANSSEDSGKHDPKKPVNASSQPAGKPGMPPPAPSKPQPKPQPKPKTIVKPQNKPTPSLPKISKPEPKRAPLVPRPKVLREAINQADRADPQAKALPKLLDYTPNSDNYVEGATDSPAPKTSDQSGSPESRSSNLVARLSSIPRAPDALAGTGGGGGRGADLNAAPNGNPNGPVSLAASASVNFGPYMAALQRKVKMSWKPPRGTESNRIIAKFMINPDGSLGNLILIQKSIFPEANIAAIEAITKASPFGFLPNGARDPIEVEFSFDYTTSQRMRY